MKNLAAIVSAFAGMNAFYTPGSMILGGYTKADWTTRKRARHSRFKTDSKHRKAILGNRANVTRMKHLKRIGRTIYVRRSGISYIYPKIGV